MESYLYNLRLSSARAQSVLTYVRSLDSYTQLKPELKSKLDFLLTANGMSYSRALNNHGEISALSHIDHTIDINKSRRVEFKINTSNDDLKRNLSSK